MHKSVSVCGDSGSDFAPSKGGDERRTKMKMPEPGDAVVFFDEHLQPHNALITCAHSETCVNLVYVSPNERETDSYGRQIKREPTSVVHRSVHQFGNVWDWPTPAA